MVQYSLVQFLWGLYRTQLQWVTRIDILMFFWGKGPYYSSHSQWGLWSPQRVKTQRSPSYSNILGLLGMWCRKWSFYAGWSVKERSNSETPKPETYISTLPFMSNLTITGYCHQIEPVWIPFSSLLAWWSWARILNLLSFSFLICKVDTVIPTL